MSSDSSSSSKPHLPSSYVIPEKWEPTEVGGAFSKINRATAGARFEADLPKGDHPFQLYTLNTPNGVAASWMLEELATARGVEYDGWRVSIDGDQFSSGFVAVNPNSKIPAMVHVRDGGEEVNVFETSHILLYLAEAHDNFLLPSSPAERAETLNWLFFAHGIAPVLGGVFGHFVHYAPVVVEYAINRATMETKRVLDLLNSRLAERPFLAGAEFTIADVKTAPWIGALANYYTLPNGTSARDFLDFESYSNVVAWLDRCTARPAYKRGKQVGGEDCKERHSLSDFESTNTD